MNFKKLSLALLLGFSISPACYAIASTALKFECSVIRPDRDYEIFNDAELWKEGWDQKNEDGTTRQYYPGDLQRGAIYEAYLTNTSDTEAVELTGVYISGKKISESIKVGSQIVWYRVKPQVLLAGQTAQVIMRLREVKKLPMDLKVVTDAGQSVDLKIELDSDKPKGIISRLCMSHDMDKVYAYIETDQEKFGLQSFKFDGLDLTKNSVVCQPYAGHACVVTTLPRPINIGTEHTIIIESSEGKTAIRYRCWQDDFRFSLFEAPDSQSMIAHNFDVSWHHRIPQMPEIMERWSNGIDVIATYTDVSDKVKNIPGILANYLPDEPDAADYTENMHINPYYNRLGIHAMEMLELAEMQRQNDQDTFNVLICDSTFKPTNYFTYGRLGDLFVMDKYSVSASRQPLEVYKTGIAARRSCEPTPFWILLGSFKHPTASVGWKRYPTGVEMKLMAYGAIASGCQGLGYWTHYFGHGSRFHGTGGNTELYDAMGRINGEIKPIGWLLSRAQPPVQPCPVVKVSKDLYADVIRGPQNEATILVLQNKDHKSHETGFDITETKDIDIEWQMPADTHVLSLLRLSEQGPKEIAFSIKDGTVKLNIDQMLTGGIWVAVHSQAALDKINDIHKNHVK